MRDTTVPSDTAKFRLRDASELSAAERAQHEKCLRVAIDAAKDEGMFFSAAIFDAAGNLLSIGINDSTATYVHHSEIVAIIKAVEASGDPELRGCTLYVTGEPCPMCAAAIIWSCIDTVVWGTSVSTLVDKGYGQFSLTCQQVVEASPPTTPKMELIAGLLVEETDPLFDICPVGTWREAPVEG